MSEQTPFRIGACYQDVGGVVTRIDALMDDGDLWVPEWAFGQWRTSGFRNRITGIDGGGWIRDSGYARHLVPGEVADPSEVTPEPIGVEQEKPATTLGAVLRQAIERLERTPPTSTPVLDALANTAEPQRPRLTWADPKPCDRWDGFTVTRSTQEQDAPRSLSPDLRPTGHQIEPTFGSAFLKG